MKFLDITILVLSLLGIFLEMQQKRIFWLTYIAASILLGYQFWQIHLYGSVILQILYIAVSAYGWHKWRVRDKHNLTQICYTSKIQWIKYAISSLLIWGISYIILRYFKDDAYLADSILTSISITATYMATLKQIEGWFIFTLVGIISAILYYHYSLYFTALTYIIFGVLDFIGGMKWIAEYYATSNRK